MTFSNPEPVPESMPQPLILTRRLDATAQNILTSLRTKYFPRAINHLPAHVTLFHALPTTASSAQEKYTELLSSFTKSTPDFTVGLKAPFPLGKKGVGINVGSFKLRHLHSQLQHDLLKTGVELTEQDQKNLHPHVTVQNKVGEEEAHRCLAEMKAGWEERAAHAEGLTLWRYEVGGKWTWLEDFDFQKRKGEA